LDSKAIKDMVINLGADLCGIASEKRFFDAPAGFKPTDIYSQCKSIVVFARRIPSEPLFAESCVPYTFVNNVITQELDKLGIYIALELEKMGIKAVPIPSNDPYDYWEPERFHFTPDWLNVNYNVVPLHNNALYVYGEFLANMDRCKFPITGTT
jgi:hypothetical protein